jgi:imidazolonepropionase-like amidohydrolase
MRPQRILCSAAALLLGGFLLLASEAWAETVDPEPVQPAPSAPPAPSEDESKLAATDARAYLLRGATVLTITQGTLAPGDVLIRDGRIAAVGPQLDAPEDAVVLDLAGRFITPGLIDGHSHSGVAGNVNECTDAVTAEVRIADVLDPTDQALYRELAGGLTTANVLHGSCNPIGGQNAVIKLRYGAPTPEALLFADAPPGIKFALGENVKQSNWEDRGRERYPRSRMGVMETLRDAFRRAQAYRASWSRYVEAQRRGERTALPPRRDLELEALVEVLDGTRLVHCHSYRADEILAFLRLAEEFGFRIATLQHGLEAYKVADEIAAHGAGVSMFSDWWAYKMEVYDAIPYNAALCWQRGVVVSLNSDSDELARHLNTEAAKAVKYGGVPEDEALKMVTLNPAIQLRIDKWVGSIEAGKHADLAVWSHHPLSTLAVCQTTFLDGRIYFDRQRDMIERKKRAEEKKALQELEKQAAEKEKAEDKKAEDKKGEAKPEEAKPEQASPAAAPPEAAATPGAAPPPAAAPAEGTAPDAAQTPPAAAPTPVPTQAAQPADGVKTPTREEGGRS